MTWTPIRHQPRQLYWISLAELCERMAFGIMLPLFLLYLIEHKGLKPSTGIAALQLSAAAALLSQLGSLAGSLRAAGTES